jgi:hypothetical protein
MYTYIEIPMTCELHTCNIDVKHGNEQIEQVPVTKMDIDFVAGSITATGSAHIVTPGVEVVTFGGKIKLPLNSNLGDVLVEVHENVGGSFQPTGLGFMLNNVNVTGSDTEFSFSDKTLTLSSEYICNLSLVISKNIFNPYICKDVSIPVSNVGFELLQENYSACSEETISIGDANAITGYSYTWTPTTYIVGSNTGTPINVKYPTSVSGNQTLNVTVQRSGGCSTQTGVTVAVLANDATPPSATTPQTFCSGATVSNLQAVGTGIVWYNAANVLQLSTNTLSAGVYYAAQTNAAGCEGNRTSVTVIIDDDVFIDAPDIPSEVELCALATLADVPTNGNTNIIWYNASGTKLSPPLSDYPLSDSAYYYAALSGGGGCESVQRAEVMILLVGSIISPKMDTPQEFCSGAMIANLATPNDKIAWYATPTSLTPLADNVKLASGVYWAAQKAGSCESPRAEVTVNINTYPPPVAPPTQTTCGSLIYITDLMITGAGIKWYSGQTGNNEITSPQTTVATPGTTYYAAQTSGSCESDRIAIEVVSDCYSSTGTVFPFVHTGDATYDDQFITTAKLYIAPPSTALDKIAYVRKQGAIRETQVTYYDCFNDAPAEGAPRYPGIIGATNNPGLKISWDVLGVTTPGTVSADIITAALPCPFGNIGKYTFKNLAPGDYVLEIARQGFITRYGAITISGNGYIGHRELLAGDVNGDLKIDEKDFSTIRPKSGAYQSPNYTWKYDLTGNKAINESDVQVIRINMGVFSDIYKETEDWTK